MEELEQTASSESADKPDNQSKEEKIAKERALLVEKVANADYDTLMARVA